MMKTVHKSMVYGVDLVVHLASPGVSKSCRESLELFFLVLLMATGLSLCLLDRCSLGLNSLGKL